ncbi:heavy metal translocating P-type ATPase [Anaerococcus vaginimassiliensis]|uniref:heavy metal translocating P-type ATPase n=1 Tax=Anaerococcus vaginimassiliensis TaxID=2042308 RepID=UPI00102FF4DE|nr:heavy metal translocating P-type ATPase [Anaerococcus vaginimassiliensis]
MFKSMTKEHKQTLLNLIVLALMALVLEVSSRFFYLGSLRKWGFLLIYILSAKEVLINAFKNLKRGSAMDENFLMAVATITAFLIGEYLEAVAVMLFYSFGELFEDIATHKSRENIKSLLDLVPDTANKVLEDGSVTEIDLDDIEIGDILLVRDGEKIGVDGKVIEGNASLDTSSITGESMPVEVDVDDEVISSSIVKDGIIKIEALKEFDDSVAAKIMELIEDSASSKSDSEKFVTRFARVYTPIVVGLALILAIVPPLFFGGMWQDYLLRAATFLVLSCPCALVLSVPLSFMSGLGLSSKNGILIKGSQYFEILDKAEVLLTDKTGTLTTGEFKIKNIEIEEGFDKEEVLDYLYNIELMSTHPIAKGIVKDLDRTEDREIFEEVKNEKGLGVRARTKTGKEVKVGSAKYLGIDENNERAIYLAIDGKLSASVFVEDEIKSKSKETIESLKNDFKEIAIVSGDSNAAVEATANKLELDKSYPEVMPDEKLQIMKTYQEKGKKCVFVGDGINDAPVLKNADVGISMGESASDLAIESSDILITNGEFSQIERLMKISKLTNSTVRQNVIFIMAVKIIILILGLFGHANMWLAVIGDVGVTIIAVLWAMRILQKKI